MTSSLKPVVLVFVGNYLPGHKAGGIIRTVVNTVEHLCEEFTFKVITRDRDVGDTSPYLNVEVNRWQTVGNATVYYLPPESCTLTSLAGLVRHTPHDALYLNSFFDPLTVKTLVNLKLGRIESHRVIVAPRGEFAWASLGQKYSKKYPFMLAARLVGLYRGITWHASSSFEARDILGAMKVDPRAIHVAPDFTLKAADQDAQRSASALEQGSLRLVFLSRVAREKNLDYALKVLASVKSRVVYDIFGPTPDPAYWSECQALVRQLPDNITVNYRGAVGADDVVGVFSAYDAFLFPTGGEAYGHVIAECLLAGTPVLVSTETPWRNLQADGLGWDLDLQEPQLFIDAIESLAAVPAETRAESRKLVQEGVRTRLADPAIAESHRQLFLGVTPA